MAKEAEDRPACAGDLIRDVEAALGESLSATIAAPGPIRSPEQAGIRRRAELTATPVFAGPATRPESPAPPTRQAPGSPRPRNVEGEPEYGVHWIGEQYTPVGEAAVATRAAPPAYTELAQAAPARRRVTPSSLGAIAAGIAAIVAGFFDRQRERRVGRRGRNDAGVGWQGDRLEARRLAAARADPDRAPNTARKTGRTRPDRTARQRRAGRREPPLPTHQPSCRRRRRPRCRLRRSTVASASESAGSRPSATGTSCRPASAAP